MIPEQVIQEAARLRNLNSDHDRIMRDLASALREALARQQPHRTKENENERIK